MSGKEFVVGDLVEYRSLGGDVRERGFVTSVGERFVFVRFGIDANSKACEWLTLHPVPSEPDVCQHGQPEGRCASCAACAACQGECGACPYVTREAAS